MNQGSILEVMRHDKEQAIELRRQEKSYKEIRNALKIPVSTLSDWFSGVDWSQDVRMKLTASAQIKHTARIVDLDRVRGQHLVRIYEEARVEAHKDLIKYRHNPLFIAGLMLYWGEGDKISKGGVRLTNTDPELIRLYVVFLERVCRVPRSKIRAGILIYPDLDPETCEKYWSTRSGVSRDRFVKTIAIPGRHKTRRLLHGVCIITVSSTYFKAKMIEWLRIFPQELMKKPYYENIKNERI